MTTCAKSVTNCKLTTMYTLYGSYHLAMSLQSTSKKTNKTKTNVLLCSNGTRGIIHFEGSTGDILVYIRYLLLTFHTVHYNK